MAKKKITLTSVKALKPAETIWDTDIKGFGCRCQKESRVFMLKYKINGRQRFYTIGTWSGELTPEQARSEAEILRGQIRKGIDPMAEKEREKAIPVTKDAFKKYLEEIETKRSPRTHAEYKRLFDKLAKKAIGNYQLNAISSADIARLHNNLKDTPYQANRALAVLSSFFSWCIKHGHRTDKTNPCRYIDRYKEKQRERILSNDELYRLGEAIIKYEEEHRFLKEPPHKKDKESKPEENTVTPYVTAAIRLIILTGARCNEILTLKHDCIKYCDKKIELLESKTGEKTIQLSSPALQLLSEIPHIAGNPYVICGKKEGAHLVNIKKPWGEIRSNAGLCNLRLHDLRHHYAGTAVAAGQRIKIISLLLGHQDMKTTERYIKIDDNPLQTANETIGNRIMDAMTTKPDTDKVVKLHG